MPGMHWTCQVRHATNQTGKKKLFAKLTGKVIKNDMNSNNSHFFHSPFLQETLGNKPEVQPKS